MLLTENEKRDIIKYLEADKPLPDKYRFLLFEDKREVDHDSFPSYQRLAIGYDPPLPFGRGPGALYPDAV